MNEQTFPKGTIVKLYGIPYELVKDTKVIGIPVSKVEEVKPDQSDRADLKGCLSTI